MHIVLFFYDDIISGQSAVPRTWRAVEIELVIAGCSQVARWKDGMLIFQNLQKNRKSVEYIFFYHPTILKIVENFDIFREFSKISENHKFYNRNPNSNFWKFRKFSKNVTFLKNFKIVGG